jgi:hypothetical protein
VERLERHVLTERQCTLLAKLGGDKTAKVPTFDGELDRLDRLLQVAPEKQYDEEQRALIAALGLGEG